MPGLTRTYVNSDYVIAVTLAGGTPLLLPPVADSAVARAQLAIVDGLLLTGGPDVDPLLYGEEPLAKLGAVNHRRDRYELELVTGAEEAKKPMLGICRGVQIINTAYGGTLYQDLSYSSDYRLNHFQSGAERDVLWHTIDIDPSSSLARIVGSASLAVNSYHHQAVKVAAPGFQVTALSKDGIIEAIERPGDHFVLGVQWHPELLAANIPAMLALFQELVRQAASA